MTRKAARLLALELALVAAGLPAATLQLRQGWAIQSSAQVHETGAVISTPAFQPANWIPATVPSTVLNALVQAHVYPDPYYGMNLRSIPGATYPIASNFSNAPMPPDSPFQVSWWYRTRFVLPADYRAQTVWLHFDAINFRANVWLNGRQVDTSTHMAGAWRIFEFDVTQFVKAGAANALAVEIFPPQANDLAITFVDWNPQPPDKNMGLWRPVYLTTTGPVAIRYPQVVAHLANGAELTVSAELRNSTGGDVRGVLKGQIEKLEFSQPVELGAHDTRTVTFQPLKIPHPRLWWPVQLGPQNLYPLRLRFEIAGRLSDQANIQFGIREVTSILDPQNHRLFRINGKNILVRGAGYTFDMLLRSSPERQRAELRYVRDMNLNAVRMEGKLEDDHFLDLCDRYGILVLAGWCCCDHWERWNNWKDEDYTISAESLRDQVRRLRAHPSLLVWMNGSDNPPPPKVELTYIAILKELNWPNPYISSATQQPTTVTGQTGVKMTGPYEYVAPNYWLEDKTRGGAHGFNTETSAGPAVSPIESLSRMLPADHLWPMDNFWTYHCGGGPFKDLRVFTEALNARYGAAKSAADYAQKAQLMTYEGERAMFEAFGRNKYTSTGVIQWMLNNAWPGMIWHLYDWYLRPGGGYFGAKKACEPLHIQYSYDDRSVVVVNSYYESFAGLKATAKVYNLDMAEKFSREARLDVAPDSTNKLFDIPDIQGLSPTYFVALSLDKSGGARVSQNLYWLSTRPELLDWDKSDWYHTPTKQFADLTALSNLPEVDLKATAVSANGKTTVTLENPTHNLAFFIRLQVKSGDEEILPVLWQDNYFPMLPGEKRRVTATYTASPRAAPQSPTAPAPSTASGQSRDRAVSVQLSGFNVRPKLIPGHP